MRCSTTSRPPGRWSPHFPHLNRINSLLSLVYLQIAVAFSFSVSAPFFLSFQNSFLRKAIRVLPRKRIIFYNEGGSWDRISNMKKWPKSCPRSHPPSFFWWVVNRRKNKTKTSSDCTNNCRVAPTHCTWGFQRVRRIFFGWELFHRFVLWTRNRKKADCNSADCNSVAQELHANAEEASFEKFMHWAVGIGTISSGQYKYQ